MNNLPEVWLTLSHKVLSSVLSDPGAIFPVHDIIGNRVDWFPVKDRPIYQAIVQCLESSIPPTLEAVTTRLNGSADPGYLKVISNLFNEDDNRLLAYNTEQLRDIGVLARVRALGRELSGFEAPDGINDQVSRKADELAGLVAERFRRDSTAKATSETAWALVSKDNSNVIPTGLSWYDNESGGWWPGENYWVAGAYKSGKTTVMRNCILHAARLGNPAAALCVEGTRELFTLDCIAMLASETLAEAGMVISKIRVSGRKIRQHYYTPGFFTAQELDAINKARETWETLPVILWDMKDDIDDTAMLKYFVRKAKLNHGVRLFWADHSQLFGRRGTDYERQSEISRAVQKIAAGEDVAICMLSQQNEEGVQSGTNGSYSPRIRGGGAAPAAADAMLMTQFDDESHTLTITLKLDRHGAKGGKHYHYLVPSGLIMDRWITVDKKEMN